MSKEAWAVIRNTGYRAKDVKLSNSLHSSSVISLSRTKAEANRDMAQRASRMHFMVVTQLEVHPVTVSDLAPFGNWTEEGVDAIQERERILDQIKQDEA